MPEAWFRNPTFYVRELAEVGPRASWIVWDRGVVHRNRLDPKRYITDRFGPTVEPRILMVGPQGTAELRRDSDLDAPTAVYPTWEYGRQGWEELEEMCARWAGEEGCFWAPPRGTPDELPVPGQEHRVVVIRSPKASTGIGRQFLLDLARLQAEYPECIIHLHGANAWRVAFGTGLASADVEARTLAAKHKVMLPNGREMELHEAPEWTMWINLLGFRADDLGVPRNRCLYNIHSALWAADNFERDLYFKHRRIYGGLSDWPTLEPHETRRKVFVLGDTVDGDKVLCDVCSVAPTCKLYRDGGVCGIPDTDVSTLATAFKSRDATRIIDGLGSLMAVNVSRLETGLRQEDDSEEGLSPVVSKIIDSLFDQGQKLAKLLNPMLGVKVNANLQGSIDGVSTGSVSALTAGIIAELEAMGTPREEITTELVMAVLARTAEKQEAIEASSSAA